MKKIISLPVIFFIFSYLPAHAQSWLTTGNAGTSSATNFIGTTDAQPLVFRVGGTFSGIIDFSYKTTYLGYGAGASTIYNQYSWNTGIGYHAMQSNTNGIWNTAVGAGAMGNNTNGAYNCALGMSSMSSNSTGSSNVAIGWQCANSISTGSANVAVGSNSLSVTSVSSYNTAIGGNSGGSYDHGWNNTFLGANTRTNGAGYYNVIAIGQDVTITDVNMVKIGNTATGTIGGYQYWSKFSDGRYKKDIKEDVKGLEFILKLRPVTYHLDVDAVNKKLGRPKDEKGNEIPMDPYTKKSLLQREKEVQTGFIAQEVEAAAKQVGYDFEGVDKPGNENSFYGLRYAAFVVPLVKGMQEQQQLLTKQQEEIDLLKKEIGLLKEQNKLLTGVSKSN